MAVRPIVQLPERILKVRSEEVGHGDIGELAADLVETMGASPACVGLAAPQVGVSLRLIAVDVSGHPKASESHGLVVLTDPIVVSFDDRETAREGCMSVPDLTANVTRARRVVVRGRGIDGSPVEIAAVGFEARAFQHEIDHLEGLLILDRVTSPARDVFARKVYR